MENQVDEMTLLARERTLLSKERSGLAYERTFLAWTRTGLASVAGGLALIRFLTFQTLNHQIISRILGCALVVLGIFIFIFSFLEYKTRNKKLNFQKGHVGSLIPVGIISIVLILVSLGLMVIAFRFF